jgi:hypothetical protein
MSSGGKSEAFADLANELKIKYENDPINKIFNVFDKNYQKFVNRFKKTNNKKSDIRLSEDLTTIIDWLKNSYTFEDLFFLQLLFTFGYIGTSICGVIFIKFLLVLSGIGSVGLIGLMAHLLSGPNKISFSRFCVTYHKQITMTLLMVMYPLLIAFAKYITILVLMFGIYVSTIITLENKNKSLRDLIVSGNGCLLIINLVNMLKIEYP